MLALTLVMLAAEPEAPAQVSDPRARDTATLGMVTAVIAMGLAVIVPLADQPRPGATQLPMVLGATGFGLVALVRPVVFFSGQPARPKPTALNNALRIIGTATALLGLGAFISALALRSGQPGPSALVMAGAAGLEALSAASFSVDAMLGLR